MSEVYLEPYSEKSFVVWSKDPEDLKSVKEDLKLLSGKWNPSLQRDPGRGWIFSNKQIDNVIGFMTPIFKEDFILLESPNIPFPTAQPTQAAPASYGQAAQQGQVRRRTTSQPQPQQQTYQRAYNRASPSVQQQPQQRAYSRRAPEPAITQRVQYSRQSPQQSQPQVQQRQPFRTSVSPVNTSVDTSVEESEDNTQQTAFNPTSITYSDAEGNTFVGTVVEVVDADTIIADLNGQEVEIKKIWQIPAAESAHEIILQ